jgi:hypothetical protein
MGSDKEDYLRYIQYEMNLNILQKKRKKRLGTASLSPSALLLHVVPNSQSFLLFLYTRDLFVSF